MPGLSWGHVHCGWLILLFSYAFRFALKNGETRPYSQRTGSRASRVLVPSVANRPVPVLSYMEAISGRNARKVPRAAFGATLQVF